MSSIKWESKTNFLGRKNAIKNDRVLYQINCKFHLNESHIFLVHFIWEENKFVGFEVIKEEKILLTDKITDDTLNTINKIREYENFVKFFERRKKISKLVN